MLLVLISICTTVAHSQNYIPKYKRKKEVRDYDLAKPDRKWEISIGGSYNMALGQLDRIKYSEQGYTTKYNVRPDLSGSSALVGVQYKFGDNFTAGIETGALFQDNGYAWPMYGTFNYYYGQPTMQQRHRWFNYVHLGPQIYMSSRAKVMGSMAGIGGGLRVLLRKTVRFDVFGGYQVNMRRPHLNKEGAYDLPANYGDFKQYMHIMQFGLRMYIF